MIECSPVSLLPQGPEKTQRDGLPRLLSFFAHKQNTPTKEIVSNRHVKYPLHTKDGKDQIQQQSSLRTHHERMIISFLLFLT